MKKIKVWFFVLVLLAILMPNVAMADDPDECKYGKVDSWVRFINEDGSWGEWKNTTVHANLTVHQPFQVKATIYVKEDCNFANIELYEFSKTYEIIDGPTKGMSKYISFENLSAGWTHTLIWTVEPSGKWTEGISPLNIHCTFSKYIKWRDQFDYRNVDYTVIAAYISPEEWNGNYNGNGGGSHTTNTPGFELAGIAMTMFIAYVFKKRK